MRLAGWQEVAETYLLDLTVEANHVNLYASYKVDQIFRIESLETGVRGRGVD